jgi:ABC-type arginine/histidine transport system permease subunit
MNIIKNSSVAFAVSIAELTMFAMQAQEETSRGIEIYLAVTGLYFISAFAINRIAHFIETACGARHDDQGGRPLMNLDFAFLTLGCRLQLHLKG